MAYNEELAARVAELIGARAEYEEKKMFGGLAFMVNTHMACGLMGDDLMVRVGAAQYEQALADGAREMDFTGRPMRGMVRVDGLMIADPSALENWVGRGVSFALSEPAKPPKRPGKTTLA